MKALLIPVSGPVETIELSNSDSDLQRLQEAVGGLIQGLPLPEFIDPDDQATAYVHEEGKLVGLEFNGRATDFLVPGVGLFFGDYVAGPMVLAGFDPMRGAHTSLPAHVERRVRLIEREAGQEVS